MCRIIVCLMLLSVPTDFVSSIPLSQLPAGITVHKRSVTWEEAHEMCEAEGAMLASPINAKALAAMKTVIGNYNITYFIGMTATDVPARFVSIEGISLEEMPLTVSMDMVKQLNQEDGGCLAMSRDEIRPVSCWNKLPYMCYDPQVYNKNKAGIDCGPQKGYKYDSSTGHCYKLHTETRNWDQAHWTCASEGGYLAIIETEKEAQSVMKLDSYIHDYNIFIGRHKVIGTNEWKTIHGQPVEELYNEVPGSRSSTDSEFNCGGLHVTGKWQYVRCAAEVHFVCQKEPVV